jgi:hypothetical protein
MNTNYIVERSDIIIRCSMLDVRCSTFSIDDVQPRQGVVRGSTFSLEVVQCWMFILETNLLRLIFNYNNSK